MRTREESAISCSMDELDDEYDDDELDDGDEAFDDDGDDGGAGDDEDDDAAAPASAKRARGAAAGGDARYRLPDAAEQASCTDAELKKAHHVVDRALRGLVCFAAHGRQQPAMWKREHTREALLRKCA